MIYTYEVSGCMNILNKALTEKVPSYQKQK